MSFNIEVVELKPQPVLVIEEDVAPEALGEALARILPAVHGYVRSQGVQMSGMPFMRYLEMTDRFRIAAGVPVPEAMPGSGEIESSELPGGRAATTVFLGPYQGVGEAWDALYAWCDERGIERRFGGWDIYENDPSQVKNPAELRTRLYLPLP